MLLAIDIGNTHISVGIYRTDTLVAQWRLSADPTRLTDEYAVTLLTLLQQRGIPVNQIRGTVISSVVPALTPVWEDLAQRYLNSDALVVGPGTKTGVRVAVDNPREVGADRIINTLAVHKRYGGPAIVVDLSTATIVDAVGPEGDYLGSAIAPGLGLAAEALFQRAARLYRVEIARPRAAIGKNTAASMQSGLVFGYVGLVEGLINRIRTEMEADGIQQPVKVIATGSLAPMIARESNLIQIIDQDLTLEGLRLIYELNGRTA